MLKIITNGSYVTAGNIGDKRLLGFSTGSPGHSGDVAVEFYVKYGYDHSDPIIGVNARIAKVLLEAELVKGKPLNSHYLLQDGQLLPQ